jgi:C4-dicarboxylate transporter, DctM subunit
LNTFADGPGQIGAAAKLCGGVKRGYSGAFASGIIAAGGTLGILLPPSITMILYAVAAEQSLGRLFLAAIGPALLLVTLFAAYAMWRFSHEDRQAKEIYERTGVHWC